MGPHEWVVRGSKRGRRCMPHRGLRSAPPPPHSQAGAHRIVFFGCLENAGGIVAVSVCAGPVTERSGAGVPHVARAAAAAAGAVEDCTGSVEVGGREAAFVQRVAMVLCLHAVTWSLAWMYLGEKQTRRD